MRHDSPVVGHETLVQAAHALVSYCLREAVENVAIQEASSLLVEALIKQSRGDHIERRHPAHQQSTADHAGSNYHRQMGALE